MIAVSQSYINTVMREGGFLTAICVSSILFSCILLTWTGVLFLLFFGTCLLTVCSTKALTSPVYLSRLALRMLCPEYRSLLRIGQLDLHSTRRPCHYRSQAWAFQDGTQQKGITDCLTALWWCCWVHRTLCFIWTWQNDGITSGEWLK